LSSFLFDPAWLCNDGESSRASPDNTCFFEEFSNGFSAAELEEFNVEKFFPGAFAYHLHFHTKKIEENSLFEHFERFYESKLKLE
jgi:hypothetical protein